MNDTERDIIMALAEGRLQGDELAAAEALVASRPDLREELAMQRRALMALHDAPSASLTSAERSALHASLRDQLGFTVESSPRPAGRRSSWLRRLVPAIGIAVVAVGFVVVASHRTASDTTVALREQKLAASTTVTVSATTTTAAAASPAPPTSLTESASTDNAARAPEAGALASPETISIPRVPADPPIRTRAALDAAIAAATDHVELSRSSFDVCRLALDAAVGPSSAVTPLAGDGRIVYLDVTASDGTTRLVRLVLADCSVSEE